MGKGNTAPKGKPVVTAPKLEFSSTPMWSDEFNATTIDNWTWTNRFDGPSMDNNGFSWSPDQLSMSEGMLHIGIERQADGTFQVGGLAAYELYGGGFGFQYGKVEIRAMATEEVNGAGMCFLLWPAQDDHWPPEVDILETPKGDGLFTNHWRDASGAHQMEHKQFALDYTQWHTYSLEWTPTRLTMLVDGQAMFTTTKNIPAEEMSVALMGYVGAPDQDWYGGAPAPDVNYVGINVDYVRVYQYLM
jgi:beta-glucanase (GH16 family)